MMATSKNCPYTAQELWNMNMADFIENRDWVFIQDAYHYAVNKDSEPKEK